MSEENLNPFTNEPEAGGGKTLFGLYRIVTKQVTLETGFPGWSSPRYTNKDGAVWAFKGKKPDPKSKSTHVVQDLTCTKQDGSEYVMFADWMYWASDPSCKAVLPSNQTAFGKNLEGIFGKQAYVQAEQLKIDDKGYTRYPIKIVKVFKNKAEMEAARVEHFAKFGDSASANSNGQAESAVEETEVKRMKAKGKTAKQIADILEVNVEDVAAIYEKV